MKLTATETSSRTNRVLSSFTLIDGARPTILLVEMMLLNIVNNRHRNQVPNTHLPPQEQPDLGTADIVLDELLNNVDIIFPGLERSEGFIDVGSAAFDNKRLARID